jgi:hypothetical protein
MPKAVRYATIAFLHDEEMCKAFPKSSYCEARSLIRHQSLPTSTALPATPQFAAVSAGCDRLRLILDLQIAAFVNCVGASPRSVQVRELGYLWGSWGHKGDLYFHWRVAMLPRTMIEYVVVHELVHLIEPNHTNAFWDRVERILSDWCDAYGGLRLCKQWLAKNGTAYDL